MRMTCGRFGLELQQLNVANTSHAGNKLDLSGRLTAEGLDVEMMREQINGLVDNPFESFVPFTFDDLPSLDGYYRVTDASVEIGSGGLVVGWHKFNLSLERVGSFAAPSIEASSIGSARINWSSHFDAVPWHAVPADATGYSVASNVTPTRETRISADGDLTIFSASVVSPYLNGFASFTCPPASFYKGSPMIRAGEIDPVAADVFGYTGAVQTYTVPAGVTKLVVEVRGAQGGGTWGGKGGRVRCDLTVTAGQVLNVYVGGRGKQRNTYGVTGAGYNGGGAGNAGAIAGDPDHGDSWGGGGASDVRTGGTGLANRVVIAGGGGGMGGAQNDYATAGGVGAGGTGATASDATRGGKGGTATAGGAAGTPALYTNAGTAGTLGVGGTGSNALVANQNASGGGGGGRYGGGGGSGTGQGTHGAGGGGGSGLSTGVNSTVTSGVQSGDGAVYITPVATGEAPVINRYVVVGAQAPNTPFGWELSNGLLKITPSYVAGSAMFDFSFYNGTSWGPVRQWVITDLGSATTPALLNLSAFAVLDNSSEECVVRCTYEYGSAYDAVAVTITLRRGAVMADVAIASSLPTRAWGLRTAVTSAATNWGAPYNGQSAITADSGGNYWVLISPNLSTRVATGQSGIYLNAVEQTALFGVGFIPFSMITTPAVTGLGNQWYTAQTITLRPTLR